MLDNFDQPAVILSEFDGLVYILFEDFEFLLWRKFGHVDWSYFWGFGFCLSCLFLFGCDFSAAHRVEVSVLQESIRLELYWIVDWRAILGFDAW